MFTPCTFTDISATQLVNRDTPPTSKLQQRLSPDQHTTWSLGAKPFIKLLKHLCPQYVPRDIKNKCAKWRCGIEKSRRRVPEMSLAAWCEEHVYVPSTLVYQGVLVVYGT